MKSHFNGSFLNEACLNVSFHVLLTQRENSLSLASDVLRDQELQITMKNVFTTCEVLFSWYPSVAQCMSDISEDQWRTYVQKLHRTLFFINLISANFGLTSYRLRKLLIKPNVLSFVESKVRSSTDNATFPNIDKHSRRICSLQEWLLRVDYRLLKNNNTNNTHSH